jgi:hypothetical protein
MARKPKSITFTGVDDGTSIDAMRDLSSQYPIEWGVLFSPTRQGIDPRYPSLSTVRKLAESGLPLAAHVCGLYAHAVQGGAWDVEAPIDIRAFQRVQVNHASPDINRVSAFGQNWNLPVILQSRSLGVFPPDDDVLWLQDASGGRGIPTSAWLPYPGRVVGYVGGLGPANVRAAIEQIGASGPYWIDMESGVRMADHFDLNLCARVCENVFEKQFA